ncbi:MAG: glycosyltransferase family A protein [Bacteroidota bacterium]
MPSLVSILITAYNAGPWLAETLDSAARQTWPSTEIIVVDDGSTDDTLAVARRYEERGVRVITQQNLGACAARNVAIAHATGDFFQFLDADDLLALDKVEVQMRRLVDEPSGTVASGPWARFYNNDLATATFTPDAVWQDFDPASDWLVRSWQGGGMMAPFAWLVPRDLVEAAGPWNETLRLNQDGEYFTRVLTRAVRVSFCPDAEGYYRSGITTSISKRRDHATFASFFHATELCAAHLLSVLDTPEARHACACLWQTFAFRAYPFAPRLVRQAEARAEAFGGCDMEQDGSPAIKRLRSLIGWKPAERLRRTYYRLRYGHATGVRS